MRVRAERVRNANIKYRNRTFRYLKVAYGTRNQALKFFDFSIFDFPIFPISDFR